MSAEPAAASAATLPSACPLDCPDACSLEVVVADGRVTRVEGARDRNPVTAGFICSKVRKLPELLHAPERLLHPARRIGSKGSGRFERLSWDQALDDIAAKLLAVRERLGGEAILPYSYGGSNGLLSQDTTDALLFRRLGASRLARTVCAAPSGRAATGLYGKMEGVALDDYRHARLIVVWGCNPSATGIHLLPPIQAARQAGARLVVVDPRRIPLAAQADLHLAPRPGTDLPLALALIRELFTSGRADTQFLASQTTGSEELARRAEPWTFERAAATAQVPIEQLRALCELYASTSPAVIRCGWGPERNRNGGSAIAAILALPAVAGKFGQRGGGYTLSNSAAWRFDAGDLWGPAPATRTINMNQLGAALTELADPPVGALFVYNSNALATSPDQNRIRRGLGREDLYTVVFDQVMTDTARYADLLLPATHFFEHRELSRGYGAFVLHEAKPVVPPAGEARSNFEVFAELAVRCGLARRNEIPSEGSVVERLLASTGRGDELRRELDPAATPRRRPASARSNSSMPGRTRPTGGSIWCRRSSTARRKADSTGTGPSPPTRSTRSPWSLPPAAAWSPRPSALDCATGCRSRCTRRTPRRARSRPATGRESGTTSARSSAGFGSAQPCGRAWSSCRRDCGAITPTTAPPPMRWRPTTSPTSAAAPVSATPASKSSGWAERRVQRRSKV